MELNKSIQLKDIENAIKETLVIKNPQSLWRTMDKIKKILEEKV